MPPIWTSILVYAKTFGILPDKVISTEAVWFFRWLQWEKALSARNAWDKKRSGIPLDDREKELIMWSMNKDGYE